MVLLGFCLSWWRSTANSQEKGSKQASATSAVCSGTRESSLGKWPRQVQAGQLSGRGQASSQCGLSGRHGQDLRRCPFLLCCYRLRSSSDSLPSPHWTATQQVPWTVDDQSWTPGLRLQGLWVTGKYSLFAVFIWYDTGKNTFQWFNLQSGFPGIKANQPTNQLLWKSLLPFIPVFCPQLYREKEKEFTSCLQYVFSF